METQNTIFTILGFLYLIQFLIIQVMISMDRGNPHSPNVFFTSRKKYLLSYIPFIWLMFVPLVFLGFFRGLGLGIRNAIRSKIRNSKVHWIKVEGKEK
jgi:hypothetical protein